MCDTEQITLLASDGKKFQIPRNVAEMSKLVKNALDDDIESTSSIPMPTVGSRALEKVIKYCTQHQTDLPVEDDQEEFQRNSYEISDWDKEFCNIPQEELFELILAANYMDVKPLLDVTCKTVANMIRGKSPEEIRKIFGIEDSEPVSYTHLRAHET
jgi:S-phase kinase-associated protein 1